MNDRTANPLRAKRSRTKLEYEVNRLDMELYRLLCHVEKLYDENKRLRYPRDMLSDSLRGLRGARVGLRCLMHEQDRMETM